MIYLASPYSHHDSLVVEERFKVICRITGKLMMDGFIIFSPIAHGHPIAENYGLPTDWAYWKRFATEMISRCDEVKVAMMPGWKESVGVTAEIAIAKELNIPVNYLEV